MEQRKLIQHGISSLTVALPMKWLKQHELKKGDSVYVDPEGNKLILSTDQTVKVGKISINVTKLDRTSIILYIQSLYRFGYDEIEINFDNPTTVHHRKGKEIKISSEIHYMISRCIGFEVVEQSENRILIRYITKESGEDFKIILRRIFLLLNETVEGLLDGVKRNDNNLFETIEEKHDNINKFVSYALRLLNKYGYPDVRKTCFYYHIIASIDKIVDVLKYNARKLMKYKKKCSPDTVSIWEQINQSIIMYYELFYSFDLELVDKLSENRDKVKSMIKSKMKKLPLEELVLTEDMKQILEILLDLTDFRMGLEY